MGYIILVFGVAILVALAIDQFFGEQEWPSKGIVFISFFSLGYFGSMLITHLWGG